MFSGQWPREEKIVELFGAVAACCNPPLSWHPQQAPDRQTTQLATVAFMDFEVCPAQGCGDSAGALVTHVFLDARLDRSIEHDGQGSRQPFAVYHCDEVGDSSAYPGVRATARTSQTPCESDYSTMHGYICCNVFGRACWSS